MKKNPIIYNDILAVVSPTRELKILKGQLALCTTVGIIFLIYNRLRYSYLKVQIEELNKKVKELEEQKGD